MIYINNELLEIKKQSRETLMEYNEAFMNEFSANMDKTGRIFKPIILKYAPFKITADADNPGKELKPRSLKLNFMTRTVHNGQTSEVRYSPSAPVKDKDGHLNFRENGTQVVDGQMAIYDIDLLYFLWKYSDQNWGKEENKSNPLAYFVIENLESERAAIARLKSQKSTLNARLWNEVEDGGLSDNAIRVVAKDFMIPNVDAIEDINELKFLLEQLTTSHENLQLFLTKTDKGKLPKEEQANRRSIIATAVQEGIISQDLIKSSFFLVNMNGEVDTKPMFTYKKGEKDPKGAFYVYLEATQPELIAQLKERLEATATA